LSFQRVSGLSALTAGFRCPLGIILEVATATALAAALLILIVLGLLLLPATFILVALLAGLDVLFVTSTSFCHD
jgi:hypothetical protein